jgi:hypothetical protein
MAPVEAKRFLYCDLVRIAMNPHLKFGRGKFRQDNAIQHRRSD